MTEFHYDVLVVGAGHAGCEAASAAARMGAKTCLITMDMNKIAQMSCNPAIGGIAKGQIVREIDALGGMTGQVTDAAAIQFRILNRSKGPAMWSPRAQCDRQRFILEWRKILENTENLHIWQDEAAELIVENGTLRGLETIWGARFYAPTVVITAGTFLNGLMHIGRKQVEGGRCSEPAAKLLTESIVNIDSVNNLIVINTLSASANAACEAIDSMKWNEVMGTIAGDNTLLIITRSNEAVETLMGRFNNLLNR
jgi:tRNA uridine 5-carboxymethylaminomethyl modification enzyme